MATYTVVNVEYKLNNDTGNLTPINFAHRIEPLTALASKTPTAPPSFSFTATLTGDDARRFIQLMRLTQSPRRKIWSRNAARCMRWGRDSE